MIKISSRIFLLIFIVSFFSCKERIFRVSIQTDYGDMVFELYNTTPQHRDNFIKLIDQGFYDDLLFHRVINDFMIQGGDPDSRNAKPEQSLGRGGTDYLIPAEIGALHYRGALAAARIGGIANPQRLSSGSQFFIVQGMKTLNDFDMAEATRQHERQYTQEETDTYLNSGGYPSLDNEYTVFGRLVEGFEVLDKIAAVETGTMDRPVQDVRMKIRVIR